MYVCNCRGVTETQVRAAIAEGAETLRDLKQTLGVATGCGRCALHACAILRDAKATAEPTPLAQAA